MTKHASSGIIWIAALFLLPSLCIFTTSCGEQQAPSANTEASATSDDRVNSEASYLAGTFTLPMQVLISDLIVYGVVTEVLPGQWNTPDGTLSSAGMDPDCSAAVVVYRTFFVEPEEILKGEPMFGAPVAIMVEGGEEGEVSGPVGVGDKVLVFAGYDQGLYGDVTWRKDAYHANHGEVSVFKETEAGLTNLALMAGACPHTRPRRDSTI